MVHISRVYTRSGDGGQTSLADGSRVDKDSPRIRAYGEIDELGSVLALVRVEIDREPRREGHTPFLDAVDNQLERIQQELFNLGAELASPDAPTKNNPHLLGEQHTSALERDMDALNEPLEPLRSFVLPGGGPVGAACHLARTVCRRAERDLVLLAREDTIRPEAQRYLNRLSDYLFVAARAVAHELGYTEVLWDPDRG
jgi:cob(I)alamin adenosyltransferase